MSRYEYFTEADEVSSKQQALNAFQFIARSYYRGEETLGVFDMYRIAAERAGATVEEIHKLMLFENKIAHNSLMPRNSFLYDKENKFG